MSKTRAACFFRGSKHQETDQSTRPKTVVEEDDLVDKAIPTSYLHEV